jgi:hypothetical protein
MPAALALKIKSYIFTLISNDAIIKENVGEG